MGLFTSNEPAKNIYQAAGRQMNKSARELGRSFADNMGYETKDSQLTNIASNVDLKDINSVKKAYSQIFKIDPAEAKAFIEHVKPVIDLESSMNGGNKRTDIQKNARAIAKFELNCDYNDPVCAREAAGILQKRKRAGEGETFNIESAKESAKNLAKWDSEQDAVEVARNVAMTNTRQQRSLIESGINQGFGTDWVTSASRMMGFDVSGEEAFLSTIRRDNLNDLLAMSGAVSDKDIELVQQASLRTNNSREGNLMILKIKELFLKNQQMQASAIEKWRDENPNASFRELRKFKRNWGKKHPVGLATNSEFAEFRSGKYTVATKQESHANQVDDAKKKLSDWKSKYQK